MKLAFVYAGQGSQAVGMGRDLYEAYPAFQSVFDTLPENLRTLAFDGPMDELSRTENTQPCMVAFAAGLTAVFAEKGVRPCMAAGLSLGEYSALQAAGVFTAQQAIELVAFRGKAMAAAAQGLTCKMTAVLQLSRELLADCCEKASDLGVCCIANYNCPGQLVIGGECAAVEKAEQLALEHGARRCVPLAVSGPFHTPLMRPVGDALRGRFAEEAFGAMAFPVLFNCTAQPLAEGETIPALLEKQVQSSVFFEDTVRYMVQQGVDIIIEIGPGKVLSGFVKKIAPAIVTYAVENCATLEAVLAALQANPTTEP